MPSKFIKKAIMESETEPLAVAEKSSQKVFSVREITKLIKDTLEGNFPNLWIQGEISNLKRANTGHVYFTLKDEFSQISAVMFRTQAMRYCGEDITNGVQIRVYGNISVYEKSGNYQIIASKIEKMGIGELQLKFLQLKEKLFKMGWFDPARKKPIPYLPEKIGIVTSREGAAIRDMLNIIYTRWPGMQVTLFPVKVQGPGAREEIALAIQKLNEMNLCDVIIAGRGGGSIEDLWAFNEFIVAEALFNSRIPVISAVGHEVDFTIADFVADLRAETPSAAAVAAVPVKAELQARFADYKKNLEQSLTHKLKLLKDRLEAFKNHYCFKEPLNQIRQFFQRVDELNLQLSRNISLFLQQKNEALKNLSSLLSSFSPYKVMERGYSLTQDAGGNLVHSLTQIKTGDPLYTVFKDGNVLSTVQTLYPKDSSNG